MRALIFSRAIPMGVVASALMPCMTVVTAAWAAFPVAAQGSQVRPALRRYDIPSQSLETALLALGHHSGIDIVYDRDQLAGLRSAPVSGVLTPEAAVARMLHGTPLVHRFTSPSAVLVLPASRRAGPASTPEASAHGTPRLALDRMRVTASPMIGTRRAPEYLAFAQAVRATIARRLQDDPRTRRRPFTVGLAVELDASGAIRALRIQRGAGGAVDRDLVQALTGATMPSPPPADMPQPIWLEVSAK